MSSVFVVISFVYSVVIRRKLEEEQPKFLREKAAKLRFIMEEEKDLGVESTVTEVYNKFGTAAFTGLPAKDS